MKTLNDLINERVITWLENTKEKTEVTPKQGMFNFRCYENAVEYAFQNKGADVVMGIYVEAGSVPLLHFWNKKGDKHFETTLGHKAQYHTYYPIRIINPDDYKHIGYIFNEGLKYYRTKFVRWYERPFIGRIL